ncbi:GDP-mannose 4,6-dehydratase [Anoxybacillus kestanbolensis]|uniref:GDP-mannose 4,6-dehydratase n=1 Tax=Anoxybacillus kestanbolensis TaxID=227476 RepID=UPI003D1B9843
MKVLVTGASGFVGKHLINELKNRNYDIYAAVREFTDSLPNYVKQVKFNLENIGSLNEFLSSEQPHAIVHLAAISKVTDSWEAPVETFKINTIGTVSLVQSVINYSPKTKILSIGSSEEYGLTAYYNEIVSEFMPCNPQNPYAMSKFVAGNVAIQLAHKHGIKLIHVRPFNHFGPGQDIGFVISDFCSQIAKIEANRQEAVIKVGNLDAERDFTDVRDVVRAYAMLLEKEFIKNGIYNVSSGKPRKISDILNTLLSNSTKKIEVVIDKKKFRPIEIQRFVGDSSKIYQEVGWKPLYNIDESLRETLEWWRKKISKI